MLSNSYTAVTLFFCVGLVRSFDMLPNGIDQCGMDLLNEPAKVLARLKFAKMDRNSLRERCC